MSTDLTSSLPTPASDDDMLAVAEAFGVAVDSGPADEGDELVAQAPLAGESESWPDTAPAAQDRRGRGGMRVAVIALITAVVGILAVIAVVHVHQASQQKAGDEAAATAFLSTRGGKVESIDCQPGRCTALIDGTAYTVIIQTGDDGTRHFGVSAYAGH